MANIGGLGGLGGYSFSFPYRYGAPQTSAVAYMPSDPNVYQADWQARYDAEAARYDPGRRVKVGYGPPKQTALAPNPVIREYYENVFPRASKVNSATLLSEPVFRLEAYGRPEIPGDPIYKYVGGYTPDFTALNAELAARPGIVEQQNRMGSAYDYLSGQGQRNGIVGPGYAQAYGNQITGQSPNAQIPNGQGVDMSWASGALTPGLNPGVYGKASDPNYRGWGL